MQKVIRWTIIGFNIKIVRTRLDPIPQERQEDALVQQSELSRYDKPQGSCQIREGTEMLWSRLNTEVI